MTDNEIIKALECCTGENNPDYECGEDCPLFGRELCVSDLLSRAFNLINRQKAEIERLHNKVEDLSEVLADTIRIRYAECKAEAVKEFAERLITTFNDMEYQAKTTRKTVRVEELIDQANWIIHTVAIETIDKVKQEMVGDEG